MNKRSHLKTPQPWSGSRIKNELAASEGNVQDLRPHRRAEAGPRYCEKKLAMFTRSTMHRMHDTDRNSSMEVQKLCLLRHLTPFAI